ncbi:MAG: 50S ribosomal protein L3 [Chloroflexi bacterium]|nr:50S ribosomal protein L3 [Chloroflexota bacterium]
MLTGLLGTKMGMTQYFQEDGAVSGVTALTVGPCTVTQVKSAMPDGYEAVQLGYQEAPARQLTKPQRGHLAKNGLGLFRHLREVRALTSPPPTVGTVITVDQVFQPGEEVDIIGISKGKGFAGGVKRWHFHGGPKTHGQKDRWRAPGSIGATTTPGRVLKGLRMAGHMGARRVTQKRALIVGVDAGRNLLFLRGSVPGAANGVVLIAKRGHG